MKRSRFDSKAAFLRGDKLSRCMVISVEVYSKGKLEPPDRLTAPDFTLATVTCKPVLKRSHFRTSGPIVLFVC